MANAERVWALAEGRDFSHPRACLHGLVKYLYSLSLDHNTLLSATEVAEYAVQDILTTCDCTHPSWTHSVNPILESWILSLN